ncbi:hypothetical protein PIB30_063293 [Stylosanthes scabra]|uniref:Ubiquitin-like protease family profile domain-containing protein n=1 Tax=Stylosanthes scabra TaxID=79078 RepID=A0ABU6YN86_9FABA|nr:hypothetical protein [Stylosanthes scabra]
MMVVSVAAHAEEYYMKKAFDLGFGTPVQTQKEPVEMYDLDNFPEELENLDIKFDVIFKFDGEFYHEVVRKQFRSMRPKKEVDSAIFAHVLYAGHWWMYVLDKQKRAFFVIDSMPKDEPSLDRT